MDSNTDEDIQECRQAVDGIITELGDQHYTGLTSFDQIKLLPNFNTNTIKEEEKFENVNDEMKNNSAENCQHYRDQPTRDETAKTPNYPDTKSQLVNSEDKHSGSNKSQNDAVHNDDAREFVMIPCDVQIARLLGWPVDLLPRVSQGYLDRLDSYCISNLLTHYHTMPYFDGLKIYSCLKHCKKRRNCLEQAISPLLTMFSTLYGTYFPF